ncbi:hypothetical protein VTL71DRAFT_1939 [Oculimacula yallundae]|uniref:BRCT domain-containing protein n=1 Tax=Oculimacula yallundae TaxID=86028 RepID=A0ABR4CC75_9HELO
MPHRSVKAAEKAAIEGEVDDWDTQQCQALRDELLPSSPNRASDSVASASAQVAIPASPLRLRVENTHIEQVVEPEVGIEEEPETGVHVSLDLLAEEDGNGPDNQLQQLSNIESSSIVRNANALNFPHAIQIKRDHLGRLRPFRATPEAEKPSNVTNNNQELAQVIPTMDDLTQRSSMSATQENAPHLYERFNQYDIQSDIRNDCPSSTTPGDVESENQDPPPNLHDPRHASASTAYTYQENDTGHIHLGFDAEPIEEDEDMEESQDESYAAPAVQSYASFEPKTPAPPINPFLQKGSVMKGFELFGATQPSSIGRHMASPTSSRPSPDVYNDFSSPPKRRTLMLSSPLGGAPAPEPESEANDATPLQSSVRNMLARSQSGNSRIAQSFDTGPKHTWTNPEPRPYVSMKDSQEKRRRTSDPEPYSSGDDSDIEATPRNRKIERELQIQREIATVELRKRASTNPRSSAPPSSTVAVDIEVPSTGRRRSVQEEYIAQCIGQDARDMQQDDVIVDSQAAASGAPGTDNTVGKPDSSRPPVEEDTEVSIAALRQDEVGDEIDPDATQQTNSSDPEPDLEKEPSLPLQELSSNRSNMRTPSSKPQSDVAIDTVPETSPPEDHLRPMAEIASISFGPSEELPDNIPGFTQDMEFDSAMQIRSSPRPPAGILSFGRAPKLSSMTSSALTTPIINTTTTSVTSSALSSPPNSAVLKEVEADVSRQTAKDIPDIDKEPAESRVDGDLNNLQKAENAMFEPQVSSAVDEQAEPQVEPEPEVTSAPNETATVVSELHDAPRAEEAAPNDIAIVVAELNGQTPADEAANSISARTSPKKINKKPPLKRAIKTYSRLKGPVAQKHSAVTPTTATPRQSTRVAKMTPTAKSTQTPKPTPRSTPIASAPNTLRKSKLQNQQIPPPAPALDAPSASAVPTKRTSKRKSGVTVDYDETSPKRVSKRQSITKDSSPDPLTLSSPTAVGRSPKNPTGLFKDMTFAVSFVNHEREKDGVTKAIFDQGGRILPDGFDSLFESAKGFEEMALSQSAKSVGFVALIADEHSRKAKYMQALALGIPCISGHWITACVTKDSIIDWSPYLLCAGQSSVLGNAHKSRVLQPYPAGEAKFEETFANRDKLLEGKSVMLVTGKGKLQDKRKAYTFLAHALGPSRITQVADYQDARKKLSQEGNQEWDLLYVDTHEKAAEEAVFGTQTAVQSTASRKRKRGSTAAVVDDSPAPKKIRIISDEIMIQSLILGQLLDD